MFALPDLTTITGTVQLGAETARAFARPRDVKVQAGDNEVALELDLAGSITGVLVDERGAPLAGVVANAECQDCTQPDGGHAVTGADGAFDIGALSGGGQYVVAAVDTLDETASADRVLFVSTSRVSLVAVRDGNDHASAGRVAVVRTPIRMASASHREVTLAPHPPSEEGTLRSPMGFIKTTTTIVNQSARPVRVVWLDFAGERKPGDSIAPGGRWDSQTHPGHPFLITDEGGKGLAIYVSEPTPGVAVWRGVLP